MKKINLNRFPENKDYRYGKLDELDEYDFDKLNQGNVDIAIYWYAYGSYEGEGQLLYHTKYGWNLHDMGHCSCYGPVEGIDFGKGFELDELYNQCTDELLKEVQPLFDEARKRFI